MYFNGFAEKWEENIKAIDELGGPRHFNHFPASWAHAMNTPFQWTKQVASHFGGTRNPMIISWPERIKDKGGLRDQFLLLCLSFSPWWGQVWHLQHSSGRAWPAW